MDIAYNGAWGYHPLVGSPQGGWEIDRFRGDATEAQEQLPLFGNRPYIQLEAPKDLRGAGAWRGLRSIGVAISEVVRDGKAVDEVRYYISSLAVEPDAKAFAHAVRSHWGVANGCHWTLDVTFREDELRIRERSLRENMAWLNRFSLSLRKQHPGRQSVAMKRRSCGWSDDFLMQVVIESTS